MPYAIGLIGKLSIEKIGNTILSLPKSEKTKYLEMDQYKKLNITTIEEFDDFWYKKVKLSDTIWIYFSITLIIFIGLFLFQKWAIYSIIIFSLYNIGVCALWFLPNVDAQPAKLSGKLVQIAIYIVFIYFYSKKNVKRVYIEKS